MCWADLGVGGFKATVFHANVVVSQVPNLVIIGGVVGRCSCCWKVRGGGRYHPRIMTKAIVFYVELVVMLGYRISDRINAIAGDLIFAVSEGGVGHPTVSGGCGQFSPGEHAHQRCVRIGSEAQEQWAKAGCRVRCPGLGFDA